ncbi:MAG TPA: aminoacyl-tRNA hydrolase [Coriobacteriia bacterium]|nr:aminoacyl-tRNA hydrolase [Coriobacteriia bacterium]
MTRLVVGLGNPGPEYARTRHNAGFMVIDLLAENLRVSYWKGEAGAKVGLARLGDDDLVLAKPQTFMNVSGKAVRKLAEEYGVDPADVVVIHDDLDLPEETVRVKRGGGHGGHNGLRSVSEQLGGDYIRVRLGIGRPPGRQDPADFVLAPMRADAAERLEAVVPHAAQAVLHVLERGVDSAMQEYNAG